MTGPFDTLNTIKVAAFGMDNRMRELMKMAFQGPGKGACVLSSIESADVFIFNMDASESAALLDTHQRSYPDLPTIIMALKDPNIPNTLFLEKPFRVEQLLDALSSIKNNQKIRSKIENEDANESVDSDIENQPAEDIIETASKLSNIDHEQYDHEREFCGSNDDIDLSNIAALTNIYYKPSDYLQEQIYYASRISQTESIAVQIAVKVNDKWELITFLPTLQGVFTTLSDFQLRVICTAPKYCTEIKIHRYNTEETKILETGPRTKTSTQKSEPFLWKVALWTSRGRLPSGTSLTSYIKLHRWPNFTRLHSTPNCMRIATLLMDEARPLKIVAKVLNVPQRHVFAFYSATYALGLATNLNANDTVSSTSQGKKHKQHSLLGRILRRLTGAATN